MAENDLGDIANNPRLHSILLDSTLDESRAAPPAPTKERASFVDVEIRESKLRDCHRQR